MEEATEEVMDQTMVPALELEVMVQETIMATVQLGETTMTLDQEKGS